MVERWISAGFNKPLGLNGVSRRIAALQMEGALDSVIRDPTMQEESGLATDNSYQSIPPQTHSHPTDNSAMASLACSGLNWDQGLDGDIQSFLSTMATEPILEWDGEVSPGDQQRLDELFATDNSFFTADSSFTMPNASSSL